MTTYAEHTDALVGGRWVSVRGIMRWQPDPTPPPPPPKPPRTRPPVRDLVACPKCGAKIGTTCRTEQGIRTGDHAERIDRDLRFCDCGEILAPRKHMCDDCRRERRRAQWRASKRKKRAEAATQDWQVAS